MLSLHRKFSADIVATLAASTRFRTWTTILVRTLFVDDLRDNGPWRVLAPTDHAFDQLPAGMLESLFQSSSDELVDLAEYHIVPCSGPADRTFPRRLFAGGMRARVVSRQSCSNGHISIVDRVAIPPSLQKIACA